MAKMKTVQLSPSCWQFQDTPDGNMYSHCYLIVGNERALLVDTGFGTENLKTVAESLTNLPIMLVNTHADGDHVMGNKPFETAHMHPAEYDRYHSTSSVGRDAPVAPLWEGDVIDLGGRRFEVILIPGHTPGSIVLLDEENRILIGGDSVQCGMVFMVGPGRNMAGYIQSMQKLKGIQDKFSQVYPGHGDIVTDSGIIDDLIAGAKKVQAGEVEGEPSTFPMEGLKPLVYPVGRVRFLYA